MLSFGRLGGREEWRWVGGLMAAYRIYRVTGAGQIERAQWIEADSDEEALRVAGALDDCPPCEVWERDRFVGRVGRDTAA